MIDNAVTPESTLAIIFGASEWPNHSHLQAIPECRESALAIQQYFLADEGMRLPPENILSLFDSEDPPGQLLERILSFLESAQGNAQMYAT